MTAETWPDEPDPTVLARLVDTHAHPTDYKRFLDEPEYRAAAGSLALKKLCAMSSHLGDQELVKQFAEEQPNRILPAFGLHPWWSHQISFEPAEQLPDKKEHYASLFPAWFSSGDLSEEAATLLDSFPDPTPYSTYEVTTLRPYLEAFPSAMLGEVGLDRSFRIPYPQTDAKSNREEHKVSKKFTELKTPVQHQLRLLKQQMEVAFSLNRNVSMHSVQAQGATVELLTWLDKQSTEWKKSTSKICLHSYGGSVETIAQITRLHPARIYFSFSTTINARLDRLEALIEATPNDRLLIESDFNEVRKSERRVWEILGIVCQAKGWTVAKVVDVLEGNWKTFSGSG